MNAQDTSTQKSYGRDLSGRKPYKIRAKTRHALELIAHKGLSVVEAAKIADMNPQALWRAIARPEVGEELERLKALQVQRLDHVKAEAQAAAFINGLELMATSPDHKVRAQLVEFFAGGGKKSAAVTVNNTVNTGGYAYAPPNSKIVDIEDAEEVQEGGTHDTKSGEGGS